MKKLALSATVALLAALLTLVTGAGTALADSIGPIDFESGSGYSLGSIDTQNGWAGSGGGAINPSFDQAVSSNTSGDTNLGDQSFRMSNGTTSGSFDDWPFSPSLTDAAGDSDAIGHGNGFANDVTLKRHFEVSVDVASATPDTLQPLLQVSMSPDRGDGARMSFLRFHDEADGLHIRFTDYRDVAPYGTVGTPADGCAVTDDFQSTDLGPFDRGTTHTVKLSMDFLKGPHDDIVQVSVDGALEHTGTSWEDYYRWCTESQTVTDGVGATRPVDSLIFQARTSGGTCTPDCTGDGYLFDNLSYLSDNSPATIAVDDDGMATATDCDATTPTFNTIQGAVNASAAGDTIKVCPGPYPEHVTVDKQLTLDGAQAGNDARTRVTVPADESVVGASDGAFQIEANKVTIDGFTVQGVTSSLNAGIWTNPGFSGTDGGHQILNNIIQDNVIGVYLNNDSTYPTLVNHNLIQNNNESGSSGGTGIYSDIQLENATIDANKIQDHDNTAINLINSGGTVVVNPVVVSNNTILNDGAVALFNSYDIDITKNHSTNANSSAVYVGGGDSDIHLDKNVLVNANGAGVEVADDFAVGPNSEILVEHGGVRQSDQGVLLGDGGVSDTLQVHRVKIAINNTDGVVNHDTDPGGSVIDASENWWGRSSGPSDWGIGVGSSTSAEVDFFPWALHPTFASFQPCDIDGTGGVDVLTGTPGKDVICGEGGDDTLKGLGGRDLLLGGDGQDDLQGGSANDALIGGNQDDVLTGGQGTDDTGQGRAGTDTCDTERESTCEV